MKQIRTKTTNPKTANVRIPKGLGDFRADPIPPTPITPKQITRGRSMRLNGAAKSTSGKRSL